MLKRLIKIILHSFHSHKKSRRDIFIFTLRRSGSSLLADLFNAHPDVKLIGEPFGLKSDTKHILKKYLPNESLKDRYIDFNNEELKGLITYIHDLSQGKLINSIYWKDIFTPSHNWNTSVSVFKTYKLTALLDEFDHFLDVHIIYLLRHPIAHSLSRIRNKWNVHTEKFLDSKAFCKHLSDKELEASREINQNGTLLQRYVLSWCLENYKMLARLRTGNVPKHFHVISYEEFISEPVKTTIKMMKEVDLQYSHRMNHLLTKPTWGLEHETKLTKRKLRKSDKEELISGWRKNVSESEIAEAFNVLKIFAFDVYSLDSDLINPNYSYLKKTENQKQIIQK